MKEALEEQQAAQEEMEDTEEEEEENDDWENSFYIFQELIWKSLAK